MCGAGAHAPERAAVDVDDGRQRPVAGVRRRGDPGLDRTAGAGGIDAAHLGQRVSGPASADPIVERAAIAAVAARRLEAS